MIRITSSVSTKKIEILLDIKNGKTYCNYSDSLSTTEFDPSRTLLTTLLRADYFLQNNFFYSKQNIITLRHDFLGLQFHERKEKL